MSPLATPDPRRYRHAHWLRLPDSTDYRCIVPACDAQLHEAHRNTRTGKVLAMCEPHGKELWALAAERGRSAVEMLFPPWTPLQRRDDGRWWRVITVEEYVAAHGASRCTRRPCEAQAFHFVFAEWTGEKFSPDLFCEEHFQWVLGVFGGEGADFWVAARWDGRSWGLPLPEPLTAPDPDAVSLGHD